MKKNLTNKDHPVWDLYDLWRTAKLNVKYFNHLSKIFNSWIKFIDITLAVSTPSGAVAALWFWDTGIGSWVWKVLITIAAAFSVIKPIINLSKPAKKIDKLLTEYRLLEHDIYQIIIEVKQETDYIDKQRAKFELIYNRKRWLIAEASEVNDNHRLIKKYTNEINKELENYDFYIPEDK